MSPRAALLTLSHAGCSFDDGWHRIDALRETSLTITANDYVAIMGPSGSGKSTLLNICGLLVHPTTGSLVIDGTDVSSLSDALRSDLRARQFGFVFQASHLLGNRTVIENVELPLIYARTPTAERLERALAVLGDVDLLHRRHALPGQLSGGERQRVAIARAMVRRPRILLCDEPTGNLDSGAADNVMKVLDAQHATGVAVVVVTHNDAVAGHARRLLRLQDGVVTEATSPGRRSPARRTPMRRINRRGPERSLRLRAKDAVSEALSDVISRPWRALLTALATTLGVGMLTVTVGLTYSANAQIGEHFNALLNTEVDAAPGTDSANAAFLSRAVASRIARLRGVRSAGVLEEAQNPVTVSRSALPDSTAGYSTVTIAAASSGAIDVIRPRMMVGKPYDGLEQREGAHVALLGRAAATQLGIQRPSLPLELYVNGTGFLVVGVFDAVARHPETLASLIIPVTAVQHLFGGASQSNLQMVVAVRDGYADAIGAALPTSLDPVDPSDVTVTTPPDPTILRGQVSGDVSGLLVLLGLTGLFVGAVGIANAALVSVMERVHEIGLRRAIGARRTQVASQFLLESAIVGALGGLLGDALGITALSLATIAKGWTPVIPLWVCLAAPAVGTITGLLAGSYPAVRASGIDPALALAR